MTQQFHSRVCSQKTKPLIRKDTCIPIFMAEYSCQDMEATQLYINRWTSKENGVCVCVCVYTHIYTHMYTHIYQSVQFSCSIVSDSLWHTYIDNGILLSHKKECSLAIFSNLDGFGGYYDKWNKSDRERKCCMISLTCGI